MTTRYILPLDDTQATLATVGGKGASLARLVSAGLPVPDGFHVTTEAYQQFVDENDLQPRILAALESADPAQPATLEATSRAIRELFAQAQIPADIAGAVAQAYAGLHGADPHVAVRSSATAEDLPEASFAGQQDTYLNVKGADGVLEAVKRCWASLWTARAIGYRVRQNIDQETVRLAVVVQLLVPAEAAGILFTANPITGARDQAVISAAWGLGEAVVGGLVTPDSLTVSKATGEVLARETADKQVMTTRVNGGTEEHPAPEELRNAPVLSDEQAAELTRLGVQIEQLYERPMDIEWTLTLPSPPTPLPEGEGRKGAFDIVQARPITALPPEGALPAPEAEPPTEWPMPDPKGQYVRASIAELMPEPLTPLFGTLGRAAINAGTQRLMARLGGMEEVGLAEMVVAINDYAYYTTSFTPKQLAPALAVQPASHVSCTAQRTFARCSRATFWSPRSPHRPGRPCSLAPPPSSPTSAGN